jgi:redox-sensitive bicupin YhaK (pirin superfamily)
VFPNNDLDWLVDPFLMLDYAGPQAFEPAHHPRGVGEHPHRGFETVTIMYHGAVAHRDLSGKPNEEPIARYDPYVISTKAELVQAVNDDQAGKMGHLS